MVELDSARLCVTIEPMPAKRSLEIKKTKLESMVALGLSVREIGRREGCSFTNIRYWLKKYNLKTRRGPHGKEEKDLNPRFCGTCGETNPTKFYGNKVRTCGRCHNNYTTNKNKEKMASIRLLLGGKCVICGFDKYPCSLDIHHLDPTTKDPAFSHIRGWSLSRILKEIKECVLVCRNCHTAIHNGLINYSP